MGATPCPSFELFFDWHRLESLISCNADMHPAFRWNDWNRDHIAVHGVCEEEAEYVLLTARRPYPEFIGDGKWRVRGQTSMGRYLQVIFVIEDDLNFVIHARWLTENEKRQLRRRRR